VLRSFQDDKRCGYSFFVFSHSSAQCVVLLSRTVCHPVGIST